VTEHAPAPPSPHSGENGRMVAGRYRLQGLLGRGGMAEVYRAHDTVLDRPVALKVFSPTVQADGDRDRFRAEVHLLASLSHPNLVALYDAGTDEARPWCALQLVDGGTLADVPVPAPPARLARIAADIACALDHVHAYGVVHRDVKPGNVLLGGGRAYLADFGIARLVDGGRLTQTGLMLGTAAFLSPEQVRGEGATPASDVYALGLVLLESLTGRREYEGLPVEAAMARLNRDPVVPGWLCRTDALGVDPQEHGPAVAGPRADLRGRHARVEPRRDSRVPQVVGRPASGEAPGRRALVEPDPPDQQRRGAVLPVGDDRVHPRAHDCDRPAAPPPHRARDPLAQALRGPPGPAGADLPAQERDPHRPRRRVRDQDLHGVPLPREAIGLLAAAAPTPARELGRRRSSARAIGRSGLRVPGRIDGGASGNHIGHRCARCVPGTEMPRSPTGR